MASETLGVWDFHTFRIPGIPDSGTRLVANKDGHYHNLKQF